MRKIENRNKKSYMMLKQIFGYIWFVQKCHEKFKLNVIKNKENKIKKLFLWRLPPCNIFLVGLYFLFPGEFLGKTLNNVHRIGFRLPKTLSLQAKKA